MIQFQNGCVPSDLRKFFLSKTETVNFLFLCIHLVNNMTMMIFISPTTSTATTTSNMKSLQRDINNIHLDHQSIYQHQQCVSVIQSSGVVSVSHPPSTTTISHRRFHLDSNIMKWNRSITASNDMKWKQILGRRNETFTLVLVVVTSSPISKGFNNNNTINSSWSFTERFSWSQKIFKPPFVCLRVCVFFLFTQ